VPPPQPEAPPRPQQRRSWVRGPEVSPATQAPFGLASVLIGIGMLLVVTLLLGAVIVAVDGEPLSVAGRLGLQGVLAAGMVAVAFLAASSGRGLASPRVLGLGRSLSAPWGPAAKAYLAYLGCALVLAVLLSPEQEDVARELGWGTSTLGDVVAAFLIVVAAPVAEELFFRGLIFAGIRSASGFWVAAAISGAIWGLVHYTGSDSWPVILQLAIFGVILAWLYERTGSIRPTIAVHALNNALALTILVST